MVIDGDQSGAIAADRSRSIDRDRSMENINIPDYYT